MLYEPTAAPPGETAAGVRVGGQQGAGHGAGVITPQYTLLTTFIAAATTAG